MRNGYEIGVNNYVKKPFVPDELDAHIRAILKMKQGIKTRNESNVCRFGHYTLDATRATLYNDMNDNRILLTQREAILSRIWKTEDDYFATLHINIFIMRVKSRKRTSINFPCHPERSEGSVCIKWIIVEPLRCSG